MKTPRTAIRVGGRSHRLATSLLFLSLAAAGCEDDDPVLVDAGSSGESTGDTDPGDVGEVDEDARVDEDDATAVDGGTPVTDAAADAVASDAAADAAAQDSGEAPSEDAGELPPEDAGEPPAEDAGQPPPEDAGEPPAEDAGKPPAEDAGEPPDAGQPPLEDAGEPPAEDAGEPEQDPAEGTDEGVSERQVVMVGNGVAGTVSFLDANTFENLGSVNVMPDIDQVMLGIRLNLVRSIAYEIVKDQQLVHHYEPQDGNRYVDDLFVSPDGKVLYVSRSNLGDVAAIDLTKPDHPVLWRTRVDGFKADHAAISPDGKQIAVSATVAQVTDLINTRTGRIVRTFPTGYYPHQNDYTPDGKYVYNSSIGNVGYEAVSYADNHLKGDRWLVKADPKTGKIVDTWEFDWGIRPNVFTPDEKILYTQLSYFNGVVKYDLENKREIARNEQPLSEFALDTYASYDEYPHDSAHHGLALSGDGTRLCDCGTVDNTVAIVRTEDMSLQSIIDVGLVPYWATTSPDGAHCFVSLSGDDAISVVSYETGEELAVVPVGDFPQRSRLGVVPESVIDLLDPGPG